MRFARSNQPMVTSGSTHFSYLLRLWLAGDNYQPEWRLALIDPQTGEQHGFTTLEALTVFLQARLEQAINPKIKSQLTSPNTERKTP